MNYRMTSKFGVAAMTATALALGSIGAAQAASSNDTITIGWTSWADAKFVVHLAKEQIEKHTDHKVKLQMSSIGVQYKAVANGDIDGMMMAWFPDTHASYWKKIHGDVVDLGALYNGAKLGWAVPDYVPKDKLSSIKDLHDSDVKKKLDGRIQGIDPGAGLMQLSTKAMPDYDLKSDGYRLISASGPAMTAALSRAIKDKKWIVVTLWTPHWAFGKWDLRFLDDPKGDLGGPQFVDAVVRKGFTKDYPKVGKFLTNMHIPLEQLQNAMYKARKTDEKTAVSDFVKNHEALVKSWWWGTGVEGHGADATISSD
jgi:glycine betaine/proline transport system substrate-binding protein